MIKTGLVGMVRIDYWPEREWSKTLFARKEYKQRREKAKELMEDNGIDALFVTSEENVEYYTGYRKTGYGIHFPRLSLVPIEGDPVMIMPLLFSGVAREATGLEVKIWDGVAELGYEKDMVKKLVETFREMRLDDKKVATELGGDLRLGITIKDFEALKRCLPNAEFVDASDLIWSQRMIKTPEEIKAIKRLSEIAVKGWRKGFESIEVGMTEREIVEIIYHTVISEGAYENRYQGSILLQFGTMEKGRFSTFGFGVSDRKIKIGDQGISDAGPFYKGYASDTQRRISIGDPPNKEKEAVERSLKGLLRAEEILAPGVKISDLYEEISKFEYKRTFPHLGHGIGLDIHEPPFLTPSTKWFQMELKPGMYLAIEPTVTDFPDFKMCLASIEDNYLITENGFENLTKDLERELWIIKS